MVTWISCVCGSFGIVLLKNKKNKSSPQQLKAHGRQVPQLQPSKKSCREKMSLRNLLRSLVRTTPEPAPEPAPKPTPEPPPGLLRVCSEAFT